MRYGKLVAFGNESRCPVRRESAITFPMTRRVASRYISIYNYIVILFIYLFTYLSIDLFMYAACIYLNMYMSGTLLLFLLGLMQNTIDINRIVITAHDRSIEEGLKSTSLHGFILGNP